MFYCLELFGGLFTYVNFYTNRDFYAQNFCVKKGTPEFVTCYGNCQLTKKIIEHFKIVDKKGDSQEKFIVFVSCNFIAQLPTGVCLFDFLNHKFVELKQFGELLETKYSSFYSFDVFHPPKYVV